MATVEHCLYCFEALDACLSKRTPMTLSQVQTSWAEYQKGLEVEGEDVEAVEAVDGEAEDEEKPASGLSAARNPTLSRLSERSGTSSPSSNSSISLAPSTVATTPESSTSSFTPIGIGRRTSQRNDSITESPLFVTWNTMSSTGYRSLRGCIGTFEAQLLAEGLSSYSLTSALHDTRFNPITLSELPTLEVSVTLLTDFEQAKDAMDWELGIHGLRISFYYRNRRHGACYLPDVAPEQGWDKEETVISLMRKAGWGGKRERWNEVGDLKVVRFQGKAESLDWSEFRHWRAWIEKGGNGK